MDKFKIDKPRGPLWLQALFTSVENAINERTPRQGLGTRTEDVKNGIRISVAEKPSKTDDALVEDNGGGGTGSGTASDIYGALNGQPAVFHLSQSADPELVT